MQFLPKKERPSQPCIPRTIGEAVVECTKQGGICSLRRYALDGATGEVRAAPDEGGVLCTVCPYRFYEADLIFRWIGATILGIENPLVVGQVGFLERIEKQGGVGRDEVGRIDHVLVHPDISTLTWCALEMQAVYFSGGSMTKEFEMLAEATGKGIPFPAAKRHPDYPSSGPKRLMPQLQIKVPTLRRWGKKMCVLVDRGFFRALSPMEMVPDISNCDIAWFVVRYDEEGDRAVLVPDFVRYTTLEHAVEGLTAGRPVNLLTFEGRIRAKLGRALAI
jgi:hypothetical protein